MVLQHALNLLNFRIPLEVCLTSNVKCETVKSVAKEHHHFYRWKDLAHPVVICTDGKGAFNTTLSNEYMIATKNSGMSLEEIFKQSKASIDHIFANNSVKSMLRLKWDSWKGQHDSYFTGN